MPACFPYPRGFVMSALPSLMKCGVHHIALVTRNLAGSVAKLYEEYGVSDFAEYTFFPHIVHYMGKRVEDVGLKVGMLNVENGCTIELIEPLPGGPSIFQDFLNAGGEGFHHVCFSVDNFEYWKSKLAERGVMLLFQTESEDEIIGYRRGMFFRDESLGLIIEIKEIPYFRYVS